MSADSIAIRSAGLVTSVGRDTRSTCAALRCRLNNFIELGFVDHEHEPVIGAPVPWGRTSGTLDKLTQMAMSATLQALAVDPNVRLAETPVLVCLAEPSRVGRLAGLSSAIFYAIEKHAGLPIHAASTLIAEGQSSVGTVLNMARVLLLNQGHNAVLIVAADTFVNRSTIVCHLDAGRLLATGIRAGFIPGEAAGALLVQRADRTRDVELLVFGEGTASELAVRDSELPLLGDGLTEAFADALSDADVSPDELDLCVSDANGEDYRFEELALAHSRHGTAMPLWLPAESLGETGSVVGCIQYAWLIEAQKKYYMPGNGALVLAGNDTGKRIAHIVAFEFSQAYRDTVEASAPMYKKLPKRGNDGT